jgi:hypothetical protein
VAAAKADKRYRAILKLYVAFVAFITVCLGVFNVHARSDWAMADWLINYTGGFVRRGFTGQIALEMGRLHLSPLVFVLLVQLALYALILYAVLQLTKNIEWNLWTITLVYSPATLGFALNDPSYAYRKEILFFALLGGTLLMLQRRRWNDPALSTLLTVSAAVCVLSHEALIVFFPYLFCALLIGFRRVDRAVRVAAVPAIVAAGCFVLVSRFPGSLAMSRTICASLGSTLTDPPTGFCGGAIAYLSRDSAYAHAQVLLLMSRQYTVHFVLVTLLALLPVIGMIALLWRTREQRFAAAALIVCMLVSITASIPLFLYGTDWTRWVYLHVFSLFLLLLFTVQTRSEVTIAARPSKITLVFLLVYIFGWNLSAYQPRIPFGGLVHYVMHQHWRTDSNL